jgi:hypothetical protein
MLTRRAIATQCSTAGNRTLDLVALPTPPPHRPGALATDRRGIAAPPRASPPRAHALPRDRRGNLPPSEKLSGVTLTIPLTLRLVEADRAFAELQRRMRRAQPGPLPPRLGSETSGRRSNTQSIPDGVTSSRCTTLPSRVTVTAIRCA